MQKARRIVALILVLLVFMLSIPALASPDDYDSSDPSTLESDYLYATSAIVVDGDTGEVLFSKDSRIRMYPASTTKIMTLLLAVESGWDLDMEVTIPDEAEDIPSDSSLIPVYAGEKMTFRDLLYGMMLHSGNDGANAVAVLMAGSVSSFVERMNARAVELGCTGTNFVNPHGYHDENHYTTAQDLAIITQAAMQYDVVREIVSTATYTITVDTRGEITLYNTNSMLVENSGYYYEDCIGVKTGTHSQAGRCLVGAAEKDGAMVISVVLDCDSDAEKYQDTERLFEYGFTCYTPYTLDQMFDLTYSRIVTARVSNAKEDDEMGGILELKLAQVSDSSYERLVIADSEDALEYAMDDFVQRAQIELVDNLTAPISEGEFVGEFSYTTQDGEIITASIIAGRSVEAEPEKTTIYDVFPFLKIFQNPLVLILIAVLVLLIIVIIAYTVSKRRRIERRRQELYERRRKEYLRKQHEMERMARSSHEHTTSSKSSSAKKKASTASTGSKKNSSAKRKSESAKKNSSNKNHSNKKGTTRSKKVSDSYDDDIFGGF